MDLGTYIYAQAAQTIDQKKNAILWVEGRAVATAVEEIFQQANSWFTDKKALKKLLDDNIKSLPAIKRAWDFGYKSDYGVEFDQMLSWELNKNDATRYKSAASAK